MQASDPAVESEMPTSVSKWFTWIALALMVLAGPGTLQPLSAEAEEVEMAEVDDAWEATGVCARIRRLFAPSRPADRMWAPPASNGRLRAFHEPHFFASGRGHMLPNGLNAPLLT